MHDPVMQDLSRHLAKQDHEDQIAWRVERIRNKIYRKHPVIFKALDGWVWYTRKNGKPHSDCKSYNTKFEAECAYEDFIFSDCKRYI